jgi:uncharacterized protein
MNEINNSLIEARGPNKIKFKGVWYTESLIIFNNEVIHPWSHSAANELSIDDFSLAIENSCEVVLLGTGEQQIFPNHTLITSLLKKGIGVEVMDTVSACRTYNILAAEYRDPMTMLIL